MDAEKSGYNIAGTNNDQSEKEEDEREWNRYPPSVVPSNFSDMVAPMFTETFGHTDILQQFSFQHCCNCTQ